MEKGFLEMSNEERFVNNKICFIGFLMIFYGCGGFKRELRKGRKRSRRSWKD